MRPQRATTCLPGRFLTGHTARMMSWFPLALNAMLEPAHLTLSRRLSVAGDMTSGEVEASDHNRLFNRLRSQAPEIAAEMTSLPPAEDPDARNHLRRHGVAVPEDAVLATIGPKVIPHLTLFAHKVTLALYFAKMAKGLSSQGLVSAMWRTKEDFKLEDFPPQLVSLLPRLDFLKQGKWDEREAFEYRFATNPKEDLFACAARCRKACTPLVLQPERKVDPCSPATKIGLSRLTFWVS